MSEQHDNTDYDIRLPLSEMGSGSLETLEQIELEIDELYAEIRFANDTAINTEIRSDDPIDALALMLKPLRNARSQMTRLIINGNRAPTDDTQTEPDAEQRINNTELYSEQSDDTPDAETDGSGATTEQVTAEPAGAEAYVQAWEPEVAVDAEPTLPDTHIHPEATVQVKDELQIDTRPASQAIAPALVKVFENHGLVTNDEMEVLADAKYNIDSAISRLKMRGWAFSTTAPDVEGNAKRFGPTRELIYSINNTDGDELIPSQLPSNGESSQLYQANLQTVDD
jgi:hypothetical protein